MNAITLIDFNSARTGRGVVLVAESKPGALHMEGYDTTGCDLIDAPEWTPTGSHRRLDRFEHGYQIVWGETLKGAA